MDYVAFVLDGEVQLNVTKAHRYNLAQQLAAPAPSLSQACTNICV
jgi:hypothetical protein